MSAILMMADRLVVLRCDGCGAEHCAALATVPRDPCPPSEDPATGALRFSLPPGAPWRHWRLLSAPPAPGGRTDADACPVCVARGWQPPWHQPGDLRPGGGE